MFAEILKALAHCFYHDGTVQANFGSSLVETINQFENKNQDEFSSPDFKVVQNELENLGEMVTTFEIHYNNLAQDNVKMKAAVEKVEEEVKLRMQQVEKTVDLVDAEAQTDPVIIDHFEEVNHEADFLSENNEKSINLRHNQLNDSDIAGNQDDRIAFLEGKIDEELLKIKGDWETEELISRRLLKERVYASSRLLLDYIHKELTLRGCPSEAEMAEEGKEMPSVPMPMNNRVLIKISTVMEGVGELIAKLSGGQAVSSSEQFRQFPDELAPGSEADVKSKAQLQNLADAFKKRKANTGSLEIRKLFEKEITDNLIQLISGHLIWQLGLEIDSESNDSETKELIALLQSMNNVNKEFKSNWMKLHKLFILGLNASARIFSFLLELSLEFLQRLVVFEPKMNPLIAKLKTFHARLSSSLLDKQEKGLASRRLINSASARQIESHFNRLCSDFEEISRFVEGESVMFRLDVHS